MFPKSMLLWQKLPGEMHREMTPRRKRLLKRGAAAENFQMRSISSGFCWEPELGPIQSGGGPEVACGGVGSTGAGWLDRLAGLAGPDCDDLAVVFGLGRSGCGDLCVVTRGGGDGDAPT